MQERFLGFSYDRDYIAAGEYHDIVDRNTAKLGMTRPAIISITVRDLSEKGEQKMIPYSNLNEMIAEESNDKRSYNTLTELIGCKCGISCYVDETYNEFGVHEDTEVFCVIRGCGKAKVGDEEIEVSPGTVFAAKPHQAHCILTKDKKEPVFVFWYHY